MRADRKTKPITSAAVSIMKLSKLKFKQISKRLIIAMPFTGVIVNSNWVVTTGKYFCS